jgi:hypothetical protein
MTEPLATIRHLTVRSGKQAGVVEPLITHPEAENATPATPTNSATPRDTLRDSTSRFHLGFSSS